MRLLILGGTQFLERAIAAHALATGHDVTCAARAASILRRLLEIAEDSAELWKLQSSFLPLIFNLVERANHRNGFHCIPLGCLTQDVVEFRD